MIDDENVEEAELVEFTVTLSDIANHCNPLDGNEWDCDPIDPGAVIDAAEHLEFETDDWQTVNQRHRGQAFDDFTFHIRRMAFLYAHVDDGPIELEMERFEGKIRLKVYDGNHRLGSAIIRGDTEIGVLVPREDVEDFLVMFPTAAPMTPKGRTLVHAVGL